MGLGLLDYLKNMKRSWKIAFCSTFFLGLLVHMYKFTNTLLNHDSVFSYYTDLNIIGSGRWFLSTACGITSYFDLPWIIGIVSLVLLGLTAVLVVDIFAVENPVLILLTGGILAAFPGVTQTFFFEFTADGYMLAVFLSAFAVWLTRIEMNKHTIYTYARWALAAVCLCLSCGIYQAHVSFGMVLALCYLLYELLEKRHDDKICWRWAFQQLVLYAGALAAYYLIWQICMKTQGVQASAYKGISGAGLSLHSLLAAVPEVFGALGRFFLEWNVREMGWTLYGLMNAVFLGIVALSILGAVCCTGLWRNKGRMALFAVAAALIPFAACVWMLVSPGMDYNPMMLISLSVLYIFAAVLFERHFAELWKNLMGLFLAAMVFVFTLQANVSYFFMQRTYQTSCQMGTELLTRIHMLEQPTRKMYVIGNLYAQVELKNAAYAEHIPLLGYTLERNLLFDFEHIVMFLNNTFNTNFWCIKPEDRLQLDAMEQVQNMPCWPAPDSVKLIGDIIVIKLSE